MCRQNKLKKNKKKIKKSSDNANPNTKTVEVKQGVQERNATLTDQL